MKKKYYIFTMNMKTLNILSIIVLIIMSLLTIIIFKTFKLSWNIDLSSNRTLAIILITYILYAGIHEILHSIAYVLYGANFNKITYGAHLEKGILYCLCKQNITRKNILNSVLFPFFYIGILTYVIGLIINNELLIILSILNISGCVGDLMMFNFFIKLKNIEYTEFDNPTSFALYTDENLSTKKSFGLKYIKAQEEIERNELKKITISKFSYICFIIIIISGIVLLFI